MVVEFAVHCNKLTLSHAIQQKQIQKTTQRRGYWHHQCKVKKKYKDEFVIVLSRAGALEDKSLVSMPLH